MQTTVAPLLVALCTLLGGCASLGYPQAHHCRADGLAEIDRTPDEDLIREVARDHVGVLGGSVAGYRTLRTRLSTHRRHEGDVAVLVTEGNGILRAGARLFEVGPGSVVTVPAGMLYGLADGAIEVVVISRDSSMSDLRRTAPVRTAVVW